MGIVEMIGVVTTVSLFALVVLPILLHFHGERKKRKFEHIERMRAIDAGRPYAGEKKLGLPAIPEWAVPHVIAVSIGAAVPLGVFVCALLATLLGGFQKDIWIAAGMVGLGGVICGTVLAGRVLQTTAADGCESRFSWPNSVSKPPVEEDAFDVVSSRG